VAGNAGAGLAGAHKGPVALVLAGLTSAGLRWRQGALAALCVTLSPLQGLALSLLVSLPWYDATPCSVGGRRRSGTASSATHNLQRFKLGVNDHLAALVDFLRVIGGGQPALHPRLVFGPGQGP